MEGLKNRELSLQQFHFGFIQQIEKCSSVPFSFRGSRLREWVWSTMSVIQSAKTTDLIPSCVFLSYTPCLDRKQQSVLVDPLQSLPMPSECTLSCEVDLNGYRKVPVRGAGPCLTSTLSFGLWSCLCIHVWEKETGFPMGLRKKGSSRVKKMSLVKSCEGN